MRTKVASILKLKKDFPRNSKFRYFRCYLAKYNAMSAMIEFKFALAVAKEKKFHNKEYAMRYVSTFVWFRPKLLRSDWLIEIFWSAQSSSTFLKTAIFENF